VFTGVQQRYVSLVVPQGTAPNYIGANVWKDFYFDGISPTLIGTMGDGLVWTYDGKGTLTISGAGNMPDYSGGNPPWSDFRHKIHTLVIQNGVNSIGQRAFENCSSLRKIIIADGSTQLTLNNFVSGGNNFSPFYDCPIEELYMGRNVHRSAAAARSLFGTGVKLLTIGNGVTDIEDLMFMNCETLISVTNHATTPQKINAAVFGNVDVSKITLYVPSGTEDDYGKANVWMDFIIETYIFVPVAEITGVPTEATATLPLALIGTVLPNDATNQTITWSVQEAGTTGATISGGNVLNTIGAGTAIVLATIANGATETTDHTEEFPITVSLADLSGTVSVTGNAVFGQTLTAITSNLTSNPEIPDLGALTHQWRRGTTNIDGANSFTYTLAQDDIGQTINVQIMAANTTGTVTSGSTAQIAKAEQTAPAAPTMESRTSTSITIPQLRAANTELAAANGNHRQRLQG
jgi:hypothetical protein